VVGKEGDDFFRDESAVTRRQEENGEKKGSRAQTSPEIWQQWGAPESVQSNRSQVR
jgi:hypothetical protein